MIARFFIDRPIFAAVISLLITLTGGISLYFLPLAQYPQITPPGISISIMYPGASPQIGADTVAAPIEQQVNGVEGMLYMSSQMGTDGSYNLTVTFEVGTNLNTALVMVQNRVALAMPQLPTEVQNQGITIRKRTPDILMVVSFYSPDGRYDDIYLSNFATIFVKDELLRVDGVSDLHILGQRDYSMRAWLDPLKLASLNLTAPDVANAIRNQNLDAPTGQLGEQPMVKGIAFERTIDTLGRLVTPEQFGDIIIKTSPQPQPVSSKTPAAPVPAIPTMPSPLPSGTTPGSGSAPGNPSIANSSAPGSTAGGSTMVSTSSGGAATGGGATSTGGATSAGGATTGGVKTSGTAPTGPTTSAPNPFTGSIGVAPAGSAINTLGASSATASSTANSGTLSTSATQPGTSATDIVRLRDVAHVELAAANYTMSCTFDGHPSVGLAVFQLPGTNALDVANRVKAKMEDLATRFPEGIQYTIGYDTTPFIHESIMDVVRALVEAIVLVAVVVMIFLQSWRAVLIPLVAVPVAIVGTFSVMAVLGFSINNISLFGLVLAIGIVVDDAIVVVENVERWLEQGLDSREATRRAMDEVTGPIVAVALVLCAVFVPCAFIKGITGRFFIQFAVTIAASTIFSTFNSLTLSPALAAILLRGKTPRPEGATRYQAILSVVLSPFSLLGRLFNRVFGAGTSGYVWFVARMLRLNAIVLAVYVALIVLTWWLFKETPTGFVPQQDQGRIIAGVQLPDSWSLQLTKEAVTKIERIALETPGVAHTLTISGMSFIQQANSSNFASIFIILKPFAERKSPDLSDVAIMAKLRPRWRREVIDAQVLAFGAAPIPGLSVAGGFKIMVEDRGGVGIDTLQEQTDKLITRLRQRPELSSVFTQFRTKTPQLFMDIDRAKAESLGVPLDQINQSLAIYLGSLYVNSFNQFGRHWQVNIQAGGQYRNQVPDINLIQVRNNQGGMVPLGTLVNVREVGGPVMITRYNLSTAASVTGNLRPGVSPGDAIAAVESLAADLPITMRTEWTELMFMQIRAGNTAMYVFALAVAAVFLALAALYESWTLPLAVILVVPLCLLCSIAGVIFTHKDVDIFVQIGLIVLVGLACKNAILIVEFASQLHREGWSRTDATLEASRLRLRPILMTSFAFVLGVVPLAIATGAGAEMRRSLGTAVFSGMLGVTIFGIFLTPVFFYVLQGLDEARFLTGHRVRWIGGALVGALLGMTVGYLVGQVAEFHWRWSVAIGGISGIVAALTLLALQRTLTPGPRIVPHAGVRGREEEGGRES